MKCCRSLSRSFLIKYYVLGVWSATKWLQLLVSAGPLGAANVRDLTEAGFWTKRERINKIHI
jgi:hypothetical protein